MTIKEMLALLIAIHHIFAQLSLTGTVKKAVSDAAAAAPAAIHTLSENTLGSAQELDGRIAVVSIFAEDKNTRWDFEHSSKDLDLYYNIYDYLGIATDYISMSGKNYGKDIEFIYDWGEHEELFYYAAFDDDFPATIETGMSEAYSWNFIENNIDSDAILASCRAQSIVYMMYFNTDYDNEVSTCTRNWYEGMEYPYEICYMFMKDHGYDMCPGVFAHEMLHTFGAPDLYGADWQFGITGEFAEYGAQTKLNDIMRYVGDIDNGWYYYDRITNDITEITAYYIGWTNSSETVDKWGFGKSEHLKTN